MRWRAIDADGRMIQGLHLGHDLPDRPLLICDVDGSYCRFGAAHAMALTPDERARLTGQNLRDRAVQGALAGFLAAELQNTYGVKVTPEELRAALRDYVEAIDTMLGTAEDVIDQLRKPPTH